MRNACAAPATDLPASAIAGLTCRPDSDIIEAVTFFLFDDQAHLLEAFRARFAAADVPLNTMEGRCLTDTASEGAYVPEPQPGTAPDRGACYVDANGKAHYIATSPPYVLAEVTGKIGRIAAVEGWAWRGNQDQPGAPTLWRSDEQPGG